MKPGYYCNPFDYELVIIHASAMVEHYDEDKDSWRYWKPGHEHLNFLFGHYLRLGPL